MDDVAAPFELEIAAINGCNFLGDCYRQVLSSVVPRSVAEIGAADNGVALGAGADLHSKGADLVRGTRVLRDI
jgi:hypothetical protein